VIVIVPALIPPPFPLPPLPPPLQTRNNNSSRFGTWTEIQFNRYGTIVGGSIINYLLEKSRIPFQALQERNYHIFYQLLAGGELDLDMKRKYKLKDAEEFHYMNQSGVTTVDTINDEKDWLEMTGAMDLLNMSPEEKECVFRLVAGILQLGNVEFERDPKVRRGGGGGAVMAVRAAGVSAPCSSSSSSNS